MESKIRAAFIYKPTVPHLNGTSHDFSLQNLFWAAMRRNPHIHVSYYPSENSFDTSQLRGNTDVILIADELPSWVPDLEGIHNLDMPVVCRAGDPHNAESYPLEEYREKFKIDYYWGNSDPEYFYDFHSKDCPYEQIHFGLEPQMFENLTPFESRIKDKIINSGTVSSILANKPKKSIRGLIANTDALLLNGMLRRAYHRSIREQTSGWKFYKLRIICNDLPYVASLTLDSQYSSKMKSSPEGYYQGLSQYRAGIATSTLSATKKYFEIPASGCLTFMEVTERNHAIRTGFQDRQTAIFINENNYLERFKEYLESPDNPHWADIAVAGCRHALNTASNDVAVAKVVRILRNLI